MLSLNRLDRIREVDATSNTMTCEAGVTLGRAREAAEAVDRLFPLLLPSEGTCTIGGNLSTNAGGTAALAYGIARTLALGLEVVLADGRVLNNLNKLKKDNTGYDLKNLFIGAEGTLGIITAAVLKLFPRPRSVETAFVGVPSPEAALELLGIADGAHRRRRHQLRVDGAARHRRGAAARAGVRDPLASAASLVRADRALVAGARRLARGARGDSGGRRSSASWSIDATIADSLEQAKAFWRIREMFGEMQRHEGGSIKHDVSVPVAAVPAFIEEAERRGRPRSFPARGRCRSATRRRQHPLQRLAAGRRRQGRVSRAMGRGQRGRCSASSANTAARSRPSTASA